MRSQLATQRQLNLSRLAANATDPTMDEAQAVLEKTFG